MTKLLKKVIGVDVGAKFLTVSFNDSNNQDQVYNIENNQRSILSFLKKISSDYCFVIEATGNYSSRILHLTLGQGFETSLINCMSVKHFARMKNIIAKTDAEDAKLIRFYGEMFSPEKYIPKSIEIEHLDQEIKLLNDLEEEEKRRYAVKLKTLCFTAYLNPNTKKHYERRLKQLDKEIREVELRLPKLQDEEFQEVKDLIQSVSGIGEKTSLQLMTATSGFKNFASAKSLVKYFGLAPRIYQSGKKSYFPGKCRTSKAHIRSLLYVCSWTAMKHNIHCKELYLRLLAKGKPKKLALIAVCNKLLRICFGVVKNKVAYQADYQKNFKILT